MRQSLSVHRDVAFDARGRTDLAGQHHTGIDISCHTVALYPYGGKFALNFDLLLPLPEQTSYLAKVRNKNIAEAKQAATVKRQQNACQILEDNKQLQKNDKLHLIKLPHPKMEMTNELQKNRSTWASENFRWAFNQETYALSPPTIKMCDLQGMAINSIQGPAQWGKKGSKLSLAEAAGAYASAIPSAAANEGEQSTAFDFVSPPVQP